MKFKQLLKIYCMYVFMEIVARNSAISDKNIAQWGGRTLILIIITYDLSFCNKSFLLNVICKVVYMYPQKISTFKIVPTELFVVVIGPTTGNATVTLAPPTSQANSPNHLDSNERL